jgi:hypothetical protein
MPRSVRTSFTAVFPCHCNPLPISRARFRSPAPSGLALGRTVGSKRQLELADLLERGFEQLAVPSDEVGEQGDHESDEAKRNQHAPENQGLNVTGSIRGEDVKVEKPQYR